MPIPCFVCNKFFSSDNTLKRHLRQAHIKEQGPTGIEYAFQSMYFCVHCSLFFKYNTDLRKHLEDNHNFENIVEELKFENYDDFTEWLLKEQHLNKVQYVQIIAKRPSEYRPDILHFECRLSHKDLKKIPLLNEKQKLDLKLGKLCVSQIIVERTEESDECYVLYYKSHYLHCRDRLQPTTSKEGDSEIVMSSDNEDSEQNEEAAPSLHQGLATKNTSVLDAYKNEIKLAKHVYFSQKLEIRRKRRAIQHLQTRVKKLAALLRTKYIIDDESDDTEFEEDDIDDAENIGSD